MNLFERNRMNETRFSYSFADLGRKEKNLNTTRTSFHNKTNYRLPQLNRSLSSSTSKSAVHKLELLDERVQDLSRKTNDLRLKTRESRRFTNFLREDLGDRLLQDHRQRLMMKAKNLDKYAKIVRVNNEQRTKLLKEDCQRLHNSSINLQNLMRNLTQRLDSIQYTMGIYSGKQLHKV